MRINVLPARYLTDEHLIAEWNEHHMLPPMLRRSLVVHNGCLKTLCMQIPLQYTLNKGHAYFFYDKLRWLEQRRLQLFDEMQLRGFSPNRAFLELKLDGIPEDLKSRVWLPDMKAMEVNLARIEERIAKKPRFYSWYHRAQKDWVDFYVQVRRELSKSFLLTLDAKRDAKL